MEVLPSPGVVLLLLPLLPVRVGRLVRARVLMPLLLLSSPLPIAAAAAVVVTAAAVMIAAAPAPHRAVDGILEVVVVVVGPESRHARELYPLVARE